MSREEIPFTQNGPIPIGLEGGTPSSRMGCHCITLTFKQTTQVGEITFRNYYTWAVGVHVLRNRPAFTGGEPEVNWRDPTAWQVAIVNKVLMAHPHTETGSHDHVSITCLESLVEWQEVAAMRIILRQPSSVWRSFSIEHLTIYRELPRLPPFSVPILNSKENKKKDYTDLSPLERLIHQTKIGLRANMESNEENLAMGGYEISTLQYS